VTILLPVWRFWPLGVTKTVGNWAKGDADPVVGHRKGRIAGPGVTPLDSDHADCIGVSLQLCALLYPVTNNLMPMSLQQLYNCTIADVQTSATKEPAIQVFTFVAFLLHLCRLLDSFFV